MLQICAPDSIIKINAGDGRSSVFPSPAFLHRYVLTDAGLIHTWKYNMVGWLLAFYMYPFSNICTISEWGLPPHVDAWHQHVLESCLWFMFIFYSYTRHFSFMVPGTKATTGSRITHGVSNHFGTGWWRAYFTGSIDAVRRQATAGQNFYICLTTITHWPRRRYTWAYMRNKTDKLID